MIGCLGKKLSARHCIICFWDLKTDPRELSFWGRPFEGGGLVIFVSAPKISPLKLAEQKSSHEALLWDLRACWYLDLINLYSSSASGDLRRDLFLYAALRSWRIDQSFLFHQGIFLDWVKDWAAEFLLLMAHDLMDSVRRVIDVLMSLVQWRLLLDALARRLGDWERSKVEKRSRLHDSGRGSEMPSPRWAVLDESRVWKDTKNAIKGWSDNEGKSGYLQLFKLSESPKAETSMNDVLLGLWDRLSKLALAMFNW